jgi:hypothetical protein
MKRNQKGGCRAWVLNGGAAKGRVAPPDADTRWHVWGIGRSIRR